MVERHAAVPRPERALRPHPQGAGAQARDRRQGSRQRRRGLQDRRARDRGRVRMAVPVARLHGPGLRAGRDQGRQRHLLDRLAEAAFRPERARRHARHPGGEGARHLGGRSGLVRPQRRRRCRHGCGRAREGGRQAGARAVHARPGHRLGSEGAGLDPPRPRGDRCQRQRHRLRVHQQGLLAHRRQHQRQQADRHARRAHPRHPARLRRRLRRAGGVLRVRQQAPGLGDDPAAARARLAAAHVAPARSGRPADPLRQRILHGRGGGGARRRSGRVPPAARQGSARHRGDQGRGGEVGLAVAAVAAQGPDRQQGHRPRHRLLAAQRHARARSSPRSTSTARPARSGRASSPSPTTAARSSIPTASSTPSRATSCRA